MSDTVDVLAAALSDRYTIERELGAGGMATVYLAEDLKHRRHVAVKVLRPELAAIVGAERFLNEIEVTANLQHPNILPLYDSGAADSFLFYVMPFIEGESLRDKLNREKQLSVDEAIEIAKSVAAALSFAHARGVVHRDIKPENILLQAGQALVADFGIALAVSQAGGERLTETGLSLGTPHYMSPEQATGDREVDARSDVYSLGAVVYEMLTGDPPHHGNTVQAIISKILSERPSPISQFRDMVPPNVEAAVERALAKTPADRFASATQFAEALTNPAFTLPSSGIVIQPAETSHVGRVLWPAAVFLAAALAVWGWTRPLPPPPVVRVQIALPEEQQLAILGGGDRASLLAISRDGRRLVYIGEQAGGPLLVLRDLDDFSARALAGTEGGRQPFFSPEGDWVAFFAGNQLHRVSVAGGAPIAIADVSPGQTSGGTWGEDGAILYGAGAKLYRVGVVGGATTEVQMLPVAEESARASWAALVAGEGPRWPHHLPGGSHALVTIGDSATGILDLGTGEFNWLFSGRQARYLPTGHLIFNAGQERIRLVPFDLGRLVITGPEVPALENVFRGPGGGAANVVVSETGTLVYVSGGFERSLFLVDRNGRETPIAVEPRGYRFPRVSPDKRWIAATVDPRPSDLWIVDIERATATRRQTDGHDGWGVWSPDGQRVAYANGGPGPLLLLDFPFVREPDTVVATGRLFNQYPVSWTRDDRLLTTETGSEMGANIGSVSIADGTVEAFLETPADERIPKLSPDGHWVAYASNPSGQMEVYVLAYPEPGQRHSISIGGGTDPVWSADGTELFYRRGNTIMAVAVQTTPTFAVNGVPVPLFSGPYDFTQTRNWAMGPNGQFVMIKSDPATTRQLQVVLNWFEEITAH